MNLQIKPHISGGYYDTVTVPARSSLSVNLWGSYDSSPIIMTRCHVVNYRNDGNLAITMPDGSLQSILPPYVNRDVPLPGINSALLTNEGTQDVVIMFADDKMIGLANDVYAALPSTNAESQFTIVNNFELQSIASIENEGIDNGVTYTPVGGLTLSGNPKFGNRCIYFSDTSGNDTSGLLISKTDLIDMAGNWTVEFFFYGALPAAYTLLRIARDGVLNNSITVYGQDSSTSRINTFGADVGFTPAFASAAYNNLAISKIGTTLRVFSNGVLVLTQTGVSNALKFSNVYLGYSNLNNTSYKNFGSLMDAFVLHNSLGLYATNFTPRTSAPI